MKKCELNYFELLCRRNLHNLICEPKYWYIWKGYLCKTYVPAIETVFKYWSHCHSLIVADQILYEFLKPWIFRKITSNTWQGQLSLKILNNMEDFIKYFRGHKSFCGTSGDTCPRFQSQDGSSLSFVHQLHTMNSSESPLMYHLLAPWRPAWQSSLFDLLTFSSIDGTWTQDSMCDTVSEKLHLDLHLKIWTRAVTLLYKFIW